MELDVDRVLRLFFHEFSKTTKAPVARTKARLGEFFRVARNVLFGRCAEGLHSLSMISAYRDSPWRECEGTPSWRRRRSIRAWPSSDPLLLESFNAKLPRGSKGHATAPALLLRMGTTMPYDLEGALAAARDS
jgi:hypothetical protein